MRVCDRRPCSGLARILPFIEFRMLGESSEDLKALLTVTVPSLPQAEDRITLAYCPFCGMRLDGDMVENLQRTRG